MPRFDSPSVFAAILDDEAGHWSIRPDADFRVEREYVAGSMVLLTTFHASAGTLELRDALVLGDTHDPHALGEHAPHLLARTVTCTRGRVGVTMSFRARPEYGLVAPVTTAVDGGLVASRRCGPADVVEHRRPRGGAGRGQRPLRARVRRARRLRPGVLGPRRSQAGRCAPDPRSPPPSMRP